MHQELLLGALDRAIGNQNTDDESTFCRQSQRDTTCVWNGLLPEFVDPKPVMSEREYKCECECVFEWWIYRVNDDPTHRNGKAQWRSVFVHHDGRRWGSTTNATICYNTRIRKCPVVGSNNHKIILTSILVLVPIVGRTITSRIIRLCPAHPLVTMKNVSFHTKGPRLPEG